jgi:hypothetical protein
MSDEEFDYDANDADGVNDNNNDERDFYHNHWYEMQNQNRYRDAIPSTRHRMIDDDSHVPSEFYNDDDPDLYLSIQNSMDDYDLHHQLQQSWEHDLLQSNVQRAKMRNTACDELMLSLTRVMVYDDELKECYYMLEPFLYAYKNGDLACVGCTLDSEVVQYIHIVCLRVRLSERANAALNEIIGMSNGALISAAEASENSDANAAV